MSTCDTLDHQQRNKNCLDGSGRSFDRGGAAPTGALTLHCQRRETLGKARASERSQIAVAVVPRRKQTRRSDAEPHATQLQTKDLSERAHVRDVW